MKSMFQRGLRRLRYFLQTIAPYVSVLQMPGGSLMFVALIASRHRPTPKVRL